jgi:hypothetical protein
MHRIAGRPRLFDISTPKPSNTSTVPFVIVPLFLLLALASVPLLFFVRFRLGMARRRAKPWLAKLNVVMLSISAGLLLVTASIVNVWVPTALKSALIGLAGGVLLSLLGLAFTRWETTPQSLFYKPNRWFALLIPLALTLRIMLWMWRGWHAWSTSESAGSWLAASGTAGSLGIGAMVAGYYFGYALGILRKITRRFSSSVG